MSTVDTRSAASAPPVEHPPGFRARRAQNWVFLGLMYGFFYMSRYNFSAVSDAIGEKFGWSNTQFGSIVSAGVLVYGLAVFLNGPLADRIGGKRAILIGSVGAAVFNFLFGLCYLFLGHEAVWKNGKLITPAVLTHGMTATTMIATFSSLWAANHYFQSFGALSIVKINAAWFHVRERGSFAGIFGIMIQSGRLLAFSFSPFILRYLPWQYCFWIPAGILGVMFFLNRRFVEDSPEKAGFTFHTADETAAEAAQKPSLGFVLRKVFASRAAWLIALSSMCIGMVRNSIDHWWSRYIGAVFHLSAAQRATFVPYEVVTWGTPIAAVIGGIVAGNASDKLFGARRAPVIFFAFVGQALTLAALSQYLHSAWAGALLLLLMAFFIQSAHSLVGGAASMDFGGKKAVATAAGLFDGAQYLAASLVGIGLGTLLDAWKDPRTPGSEYDVWPLAPLPFAIIGALLIARLWYVVPGRAVVDPTAEQLMQRERSLALVHLAQRMTLGIYALLAGAASLLSIILPQQVARELNGHGLVPPALLQNQLHAGAQLGLAVVALTAAWMARPPRALIRAVLIALIAMLAGTLFSAVTGGVPWTELATIKRGLWLDGFIATALLATSVARTNLRALPQSTTTAAKGET
jgi:OPA family glycerol-3-phosphate transporter-like MFS transporter